MSVVPLPYRILFVNAASLFWSAFLSNMMANAKGAAAAPAARAVLGVVTASAGKADQGKKKAEL